MTTDDLEMYFDSPAKIAEFFDITPETFYQWRKKPGKLIPKGRACEAAIRTNGVLSVDLSLYGTVTA